MPLINNNNSTLIISKILSILIPISFVVGNAAINVLSFLFFIFFLFNLILNKNFNFLKQNYFILLLICYMSILSSLILSEFSNIIFFKSLVLFKIAILPICFQYFFIKFPLRLTFFYVCFLIVLFACFDAWVQYFFDVNLLGSTITSINDSSRRISGIFFDEKILGSFLKVFSLFGFCYVVNLYKIKKTNIYFTYLFFIFCFFSILITQERSSFIVFSLMSIFIFFYTIFINKKNILFLVLPVIIILYLFSFDSYLKNRYISSFSTSAGFGTLDFQEPTKEKNNNTVPVPSFNINNVMKNFTIKNSLWGAHFVTANQIFKNNLFVGSGPRTFRYECRKKEYDRLDVKYLDKRCSTHPHNFVFEILSELGLFGFITFFCTFTYIIYSRAKVFLNINSLSYKLIFLMFLMYNWPVATTGSFFASQNIFINSLILGLLFSYKGKHLFNSS